MVTDKIVKLANTLIIFNKSSDVTMMSFAIKEGTETIRYLRCAILCKSLWIEVILIENLVFV